MNALGVIDLDAVTDLEITRRRLRRIAAAADLDLVDVLTFRSVDPKWVFRLLESVHRFSAHAVVVEDTSVLHGFDRAVTGVADLVSRFASTPYVGYGSGHTRPSLARLADAR